MPDNHLLSHASLTGKRVIIRLDLDLPLRDGQIADNQRLLAALPSLKQCIAQAKNTLIIGHLGRPTGEDPNFSLTPILEELKRLIDQDIPFITNLDGLEKSYNYKLALLENLRFWPGEATSDPIFAQLLSANFDLFIHDAFAASHRPSASGIGVPSFLPSLIGYQFEAELKALDPIINGSKRPITLILGGAKADKIENVDKLLTHVDNLLLGGSIVAATPDHPKLVKAQLTDDGLDITPASIDIFRSYISTATTLIWNGPVGKYEDSFHAQGTQALAESIAAANAYKVAGGGDTLAAIKQFNLSDKFDHLCVGGGAMLDLIANGTLPSLEAVLNSPTTPIR